MTTLFKNLKEDEIEIYLDTLREGATPFDRFASRGDIQDPVDVPTPRKAIDNAVFRAIRQTKRDKSTRLIPILGQAGSGKTHTYWAFKDREIKAKGPKENVIEEDLEEAVDWSIVYVSSPPAPIRILLHVYTCLIDEIGAEVLQTVAEKLVDRWGGFKRKGLFGKVDVDEVIQQGIREYPGVFADCVKALVIYELDKTRKPMAERWLLGEDMDESELDNLGINSVIEDDDICLAMIKLITEHLDKVVLFYFDELESPYRTHGEAAEIRFLETLKRLYNEVKNIVIIGAVLKEIWPRILEIADQPLRSRMEPELEIKPFTFADVKLYFAKSMEVFWNENNLNPPLYPLFPLNETVLETIFNKTKGNPRETIKLARMFVDKIVNEEMTLEQLATDKDIQAVPSAEVAAAKIAAEQAKLAPKPAATQTTAAATSVTPPKSEVATRIEEILKQEEYIVEVNPASVAGASLKCIKVYADKINKQPKVNLEWKFTLEKKTAKIYTLAGMIEFEGRKIGLEVPSVKNFDRSGGVAAFYAAQRLSDAIELNIVTEAILLVPEGTGGAKYVSLLKKFTGKLHVAELTQDSAEELIRSAMKDPSFKGWEICHHVFGAAIDQFKPAPPAPKVPKPETGKDEEGKPAEKPAAGPAPGAKPATPAPVAKPAAGPTPGAKPATPAPGAKPAAGPAPGAKPTTPAPGAKPAAGPAPGAKPATPAPGAKPAAGPAPGAKPATPAPGAKPAAGPTPGAKPATAPAKPADKDKKDQKK